MRLSFVTLILLDYKKLWISCLERIVYNFVRVKIRHSTLVSNLTSVLYTIRERIT